MQRSRVVGRDEQWCVGELAFSVRVHAVARAVWGVQHLASRDSHTAVGSSCRRRRHAQDRDRLDLARIALREHRREQR